MVQHIQHDAEEYPADHADHGFFADGGTEAADGHDLEKDPEQAQQQVQYQNKQNCRQMNDFYIMFNFSYAFIHNKNIVT